MDIEAKYARLIIEDMYEQTGMSLDEQRRRRDIILSQAGQLVPGENALDELHSAIVLGMRAEPDINWLEVSDEEFEYQKQRMQINKKRRR
ncbi:MAG: hypothetical protein RR232_03380 [Clostridia bacterium]